MRLLVVGHVVHKIIDSQFFAYGPYVKEMNLWFKHVDEVRILAPLSSIAKLDPIDLPYQHSNLILVQVSEFSITSFSAFVKALIELPGIIRSTWDEMKSADHIHLRCPGNMGLVGAVVQLFFPKKQKSAKYAGNWDRTSAQPFTFRLQQRILSNPAWTKNMKVLVYGEWANESENIKPFFTATYSESDIIQLEPRSISGDQRIKLIFAGGLNTGKQPMLSAEICLQLRKSGIDCSLDFYGEGPERDLIQSFIASNNLENHITIHGNQPAEILKVAYQESHFLIFISKSEGWPKVVAESMFWGCLPVTTAVSCVPQMLGDGSRGELVNPDVEEISSRIISLITNPEEYARKSANAMNWSRAYTLEKFDNELESILNASN